MVFGRLLTAPAPQCIVLGGVFMAPWAPSQGQSHWHFKLSCLTEFDMQRPVLPRCTLMPAFPHPSVMFVAFHTLPIPSHTSDPQLHAQLRGLLPVRVDQWPSPHGEPVEPQLVFPH